MPKSTRSHRPDKSNKPKKPYEDYPLFPHSNGCWAKKIRGKLHYFGVWADWQAALNKYQDQRDDLHAGRIPRDDTRAGVVVRHLCNCFLTSKRDKLDTGQLSPQSFTEYHAACARVIEAFGRERLVSDLRPSDFQDLRLKFPAAWGPVRRGKVIQLIRSIFRFASEQELIDRPIKFGDFKRPGKAVLRIHRAKMKARNGGQMFAAAELRQVIERANMPFRVMLLLAANTGFGNTDCARLPLSALDLAGGWVNFPRPKTGIERRCPLWPETVAALREAIAKRPAPKNQDDANLVFLTQRGLPWVKVHFHQEVDSKVRIVQDDAASKELQKLRKQLGIDRRGLGFYAIRHGFQTVGEETRDAAAVHYIMGHADDANDMSAVYRERISDERLRRVADYVRAWLFAPTTTEAVQ
jgi:integrase